MSDLAKRLRAHADWIDGSTDPFLVNVMNDVREAAAALSPPPAVGEVADVAVHFEGDFAKLVNQCWSNLIEKDDRNSPVEYPEMALIEWSELAAYMREAMLSASPAPPSPARDALVEALRNIKDYTLEEHGVGFGTAFMDVQRIAADALAALEQEKKDGC